MSEKKNTVQLVRELAEPIAESLGLILWDVRFQKEGTNWYLRIFIDKEGGVNMEDCVNMSHAIDTPLDELDPIEQSYSLQVSSPGVERDLIHDEHFLRFIGSDIMFKLPKAVDSKKEFHAKLEAYNDGILTVVTDDGKTMEINKKDTMWVRLDDFRDFN